MSNRQRRPCPLCGKVVVKLSNHLGQVHRLTGADRRTLLKEAKAAVTDARTKSNPTIRRQRECPFCSTLTTRLPDHLATTHKLRGPRWTGCRNLLLQAADDPENREYKNFVLFFRENGVQILEWPTCYVEPAPLNTGLTHRELSMPWAEWVRDLPASLHHQTEVAADRVFRRAALPAVLDSDEDNDDDDVHDDDTEDVDGPVSIDINYLRPITTPKRIKAKLPLSAWATQHKLCRRCRNRKGEEAR